MKILIDLTSLSYHMTGIERYALCVAEKIVEQDKKNEYVFLFRNEINPELKEKIDGKRVKAIIIKGNNKLLFFQVAIPLALYKAKADRYFFPAFESPILFFNKQIYTTVHDMNRWDGPSKNWLYSFYFRLCGTIGIKAAKKIFTVSEYSKRRIHDIKAKPLDDIFVTYSGITERLTDSKKSYEEIKKTYNLPDKYIMYLSTLHPNKNLALLLEAYTEVKNLIDYNLVLIGRKGWDAEKLIQDYMAEERIIMTGFIDDEDVAQVYRNALCFVFPSKYEGFGLPPLEALALGTPVISSDATCMPEILQDQVVYFKSDNKGELKKLLLQLSELTPTMPRELNEFQKTNYTFDAVTQKILEVLIRE